VLASELELANAFEKVAKKVEPKHAAWWMVRDVKRVLEYHKLSFKESPFFIDTKFLSDFVIGAPSTYQPLITNITVTSGQKILEEKIKNPDMTFQELGEHHKEIKEDHIIKEAVMEAIKENSKAIEDFLNGKEGALNYVVGQVMKKTKGRADPGTVLKMLKEKINS
jgi:aspartyl-tRNA(Asn)/glutamyl-tRNA(Gln) amidotransferase subunit B